mmetsp:Transcript_20712/g.30790  ORF Transcript_20712/g.30790 Transcript_20712/m.30790 type:complete len:207 (-) Transcript_20712:9-629(-)
MHIVCQFYGKKHGEAKTPHFLHTRASMWSTFGKTGNTIVPKSLITLIKPHKQLSNQQVGILSIVFPLDTVITLDWSINCHHKQTHWVVKFLFGSFPCGSCKRLTNFPKWLQLLEDSGIHQIKVKQHLHQYHHWKMCVPAWHFSHILCILHFGVTLTHILTNQAILNNAVSNKNGRIWANKCVKQLIQHNLFVHQQNVVYKKIKKIS